MATVYQVLNPEEAQFLSTAFPQILKLGTIPVFGLAFDASAAADETAYFKFHALNYGSGNLTVDIYWYADTATTGNIIWQAGVAAITPDTDTQDVETKAMAAVSQVTTAHLGTTAQRVQKSTVTISTLDSIAARDVCWLTIGRDGNNASDTMAGDGIVIQVVLSYSDT